MRAAPSRDSSWCKQHKHKKMFEDLIWRPSPTLLTPLAAWFLTITHGILTSIIVRYIISKEPMSRTLLDTSNVALVTALFMESIFSAIVNTILSATINAGWAISNCLGFAGYFSGFLSHSELLANALIQACVIAFPCSLYSTVFTNMTEHFVRLGLPFAAVLSYGLLEVFSNTKFIATDHLMGQHSLSLVEDPWSIALLLLSSISALTTLCVRIYLYLLRKRLNLPSENNIISNLSMAVLNIVHPAVAFYVRVTLEPGKQFFHTNMIKTSVAAWIVYSNSSIWNYACKCPFIKHLARCFKRRQVMRINDRDSGSEKMKTYPQTTITLNENG